MEPHSLPDKPLDADRKTVLLMIHTLGIGGSERQTSMLARALDPAKFHVIVGAFHTTGLRRAELTAAGIEVVEFPLRSFFSPALWARRAEFRRFLRQRQVAIVHPFDYPTVLFCALGAPGAGVRFISSQRGQRLLTPTPYRQIIRAMDRLAKTLVVNSDYIRQEMITAEGWKPEQIRLVHNAIDLEAFAPPAGGSRLRPAPLEQAGIVVGCVAALRPEKDLQTLVAAIGRLAPRFPGLRLLVVGSGSVLPALQSQAAQLGISEACCFIPQTPNVLPWLQSMDIFVLPSISEALSNSLMEAMATGAAAIASHVGGNVELIEHNRTGLLFQARQVEELATALETLITRPDYRLELARAGRQFIEDNFSARAAGATLGAVYLES